MKWSAVLMLPILLSANACATSGPGSYCDNAFPIPFDKADVVTSQTETLIIKHNEKGEALCKWKAPH